MIEKYFRPGVRLKWNKPRDGKTNYDGAIVKHPAITGQMICEGIDPHVGNVLTRRVTHYRHPEIKKNTIINYHWLNYSPGQTAVTKLRGDTLSGWMSGCYIVKWTDPLGKIYIAHVGTTTDETLNQLTKNTFGLSMAHTAQGYSPKEAWSENERMLAAKKWKTGTNTQTVSLVTGTGQFYSVLLVDIGRNPDNIKRKALTADGGGIGLPVQIGTDPYYLVAGIKLVPPLLYDSLLDQLT